MLEDPGQRIPIQTKEPVIYTAIKDAKSTWEKEVLSELDLDDIRPFPVGDPDCDFTQLPARDAISHGNIERSNRWPNCSFYTNWTSLDDSITWDIEVLKEGIYEAVIYYTCSQEDTGSTIQLNFNSNSITNSITISHDPPLKGMENDRVVREESYVKDFAPLVIGNINLNKGLGTLTLKPINIPGKYVMDFRLMMLKRRVL
jgi:hypothetical protein